MANLATLKNAIIIDLAYNIKYYKGYISGE